MFSDISAAYLPAAPVTNCISKQNMMPVEPVIILPGVRAPARMTGGRLPALEYALAANTQTPGTMDRLLLQGQEIILEHRSGADGGLAISATVFLADFAGSLQEVLKSGQATLPLKQFDGDRAELALGRMTLSRAGLGLRVEMYDATLIDQSWAEVTAPITHATSFSESPESILDSIL